MGNCGIEVLLRIKEEEGFPRLGMVEETKIEKTRSGSDTKAEPKPVKPWVKAPAARIRSSNR